MPSGSNGPGCTTTSPIRRAVRHHRRHPRLPRRTRAAADDLGYTIVRDAEGGAVDARCADRQAVFVGDLVDRGPDTPGVLRLVMGMVASGNAYCVPGNHEDKLLALRGKKVKLTHGLDESLAQLAAEAESSGRRSTSSSTDLSRTTSSTAATWSSRTPAWSSRCRPYLRPGPRVLPVRRDDGETDGSGSVRYPWANEYRGRAMVVYGHTPTPEPEWINNTICLDTGACSAAS